LEPRQEQIQAAARVWRRAWSSEQSLGLSRA
jgi:hypothetical protein